MTIHDEKLKYLRSLKCSRISVLIDSTMKRDNCLRKL